ncbi:SEL1-like repeat protein [Pelistega europaea]|uniref:SEL1-like repeat protein n=1 Tax=Pelistega europaea TaxID=106147 RepID=A0A7Y4L7Y0_9BURK|nr:SEL1-like repeat protein [Pelistega europaea]NOL48635.1 SEL1-like repeat protein [Pelistega europaea]
MAAEQGNATAQFNLGLMYSTGKYITKDKVKALDYYMQAYKNDDSLVPHIIHSLKDANMFVEADEFTKRYELGKQGDLAEAMYCTNRLSQRSI